MGSIYFKIHLGLKVQGKNGLGQRVYCRAKPKTFGMVLEAPRTQKTACFTYSLGITGYFFYFSHGFGDWPASNIPALSSNVKASGLVVLGVLIYPGFPGFYLIRVAQSWS